MKQMIVTLAMMVMTITAFAGEEKVSEKVLQAFKTEFTTAADAQWTAAEGYYFLSFSTSKILPVPSALTLTFLPLDSSVTR